MKNFKIIGTLISLAMLTVSSKGWAAKDENYPTDLPADLPDLPIVGDRCDCSASYDSDCDYSYFPASQICRGNSVMLFNGTGLISYDKPGHANWSQLHCSVINHFQWLYKDNATEYFKFYFSCEETLGCPGFRPEIRSVGHYTDQGDIVYDADGDSSCQHAVIDAYGESTSCQLSRSVNSNENIVFTVDLDLGHTIHTIRVCTDRD